MADEVICGGCEEPITGKPYRTLRGKPACSARCAGRVLASLPKERKEKGAVPKGKSQRQLRNQMLKENKELLEAHGIITPRVVVVPPDPPPLPFFLAPEDEAIASGKTHGWNAIQFDKRTYHVLEVTLLVKSDANRMWRVFGHMRNVYAYTDPKLGLLLRPNMGGFGQTFDDIPAALKVVKKAIYKRTKKAEEEEAVEAAKPKPKVEIVSRSYKPAEHASYGNISSDPHTKRFWLIESMLQGGSAREIVQRADTLAKKAGYFEEGAIFETMPKNPANIRKFYKEVRAKQQKMGIQSRVTETDNGVFQVEVIKP